MFDQPEVTRPKKRRQVNTRLFLILGLALLVGAPGLYFLQQFQLQNTAGNLRTEATRLRKEGELESAIKYLRQYLELRPDADDYVDSMAELGEMRQEVAEEALKNASEDPQRRIASALANLQDAFEKYEEVLRREPSRDETRRQAVSVCIDLFQITHRPQSVTDARAHLAILLPAHPEDGELHYWAAQCDLFDRKFDQAQAGLEQAIELGYREVPAYSTLCLLLREYITTPDPAKADKYITELEATIPDEFAAALAVTDYNHRYRRYDEGLASARKAVELAETAVQQQQAVSLQTRITIARTDSTPEEFEEARKNIAAALEAQPVPQLFVWSSSLERAAGDSEAALEVLQRGRTALPNSSLIVAMLAEEFLNRKDFEAAEKLITSGGVLDQLQAPQVDRQYLQGRLYLERVDGESNLREAEKCFERVRTLTASGSSPAEFGRSVQLSMSANLRLGECYRRMGRHEEQLAAFERVLEADPNSQAALRGKADALVRLGRPSEATASVKSLVKDEPNNLQSIVQQIEAVMRRPAASRNWAEVDAALLAELQEDPNSVDARILQANVALIKGDADAARELLKATSDDNPANLAAWLARARLAIQRTDWDEALALLEKARDQAGDSAVLRIAFATYWTARGGSEAAARLDELAQDLDGDIPREQHAPLLEALAGRRAARGEMQAAHALRARAAELAPENVQLQFQLFNLGKVLSLNAKPDELDAYLASMQQARDRLVKVEGENGPMILATHVIDLIEPSPHQKAQPTTADLEQARTILARVAELRPGWHLVPLCQAQIDWEQAELAEGDKADVLRRTAAAGYMQAIESGSRDTRVITRLTTLLIDQQRWPELADFIQLLWDAQPELVQQIVRAEILRKFTALKQTSADGTNPESVRRLYQVAQNSVPAGSTDAADAYFLGRLRLADGQKEVAVEDFVRAIEQAPGFTDGWLTLIRTLVSQNRAAEAERLLQGGAELIPEVLRPQLLAACYEVLGRLDVAEEQWRLALEATQSDPNVVQNVLMYYSRTNQLDKAEAFLRPILAEGAEHPPTTKAWARRALATVLTQSSTPRFEEALELLSEGDANETDRVTAQVVKARLLASRPYRENRREAITILETIDADQKLSVENQRFLAGLLDATGQSEKAQALWNRIIEEHPTDAQVIVAYLRWQIDQGGLADAEKRLAQLAAVAPLAFDTTELKARLLLKQENPGEAVKTLTAFVDLNDVGRVTRVDRLRLAANLLDRLIDSQPVDDQTTRPVLVAAAEPVYRELQELAPETMVDRARFLAKQGQLDAALDLCEQAIKDEKTAAMSATATAVALLHLPGTTPEHIQRVEELLTLAEQQAPRSLAGMLQFAELRDLHEQRYDEAIALYEQLIKQAPQHYVALNNLSWLLSMWKQEHARAAEMIGTALHVAGNVPALLDTQGMILLNSGATADAIAKFELALEQSEMPAANYHLARALLKLDKREDAEFNMRKALDEGLEAVDLHPLERAEFEKLAVELGKP